MKRGSYLVVLGAVLSTVIVPTGGAQVYPVRWDQEQTGPEHGAPIPPSLVLADGGIEFPDGSVQTTAALSGPPAPIPRTGQTTCYDDGGGVVACGTGVGLGQDGDLQLGVTWPNPRFTKNGDGTVTDHLTGLIWLQDASCAALAGTDASGRGDWATALSAAGLLANGTCSLTDGSAAGDWRLPNLRELQSLAHYGFFNPALPNTAGTGQWVEDDPFSGVVSLSYWSSTTETENTTSVWSVELSIGDFSSLGKVGLAYVWPVRGGQVTLPPLVLADGGIEFPDGSVQTTAAQVVLTGPALVPVTGQTICYDAAGSVIDCATGIGPGQDGDLQVGVTWPNPRFTDNGNGTVTDNLTGLIWLDDANCFGNQLWANAQAKANALFDGCSDCGGTNNDCGLTDNSIVGQWRLPNLREMQSLAHYGFFDPALPNAAGTGQWVEDDPFTGVVSLSYWSSTTDTSNTTRAWNAGLFEGGLSTTAKTGGNPVWPVRGGQ